MDSNRGAMVVLKNTECKGDKTKTLGIKDTHKAKSLQSLNVM